MQEMQEVRVRQLQKEFKYKHRNQKKNYIFEDEFPRAAVTREYLHPQVDRSPAPFSWSGLQYAAHMAPGIYDSITTHTKTRRHRYGRNSLYRDTQCFTFSSPVYNWYM